MEMPLKKTLGVFFILFSRQKIKDDKIPSYFVQNVVNQRVIMYNKVNDFPEEWLISIKWIFLFPGK
ncbi:hypothetical protein Bccel_1079 [Pseudobacteroides cellulosolvens ATCC 35603 = DSM 2933]|uniref:Uncharacterized protein n=1 Tax=Pseudobacteroides cellulosolvens ATCC 35603 = DSM 2933 TaxID=398512 RepID=A0A0L6JJ95_9FIRM|nr:hypothetical protein Bccel_1079 [Pseudobacteroides cellulosolvens ATCC 35603 = DSM 2933]